MFLCNVLWTIVCFCRFAFGHCIGCSSSIYGCWLLLLYLSYFRWIHATCCCLYIYIWLLDQGYQYLRSHWPVLSLDVPRQEINICCLCYFFVLMFWLIGNQYTWRMERRLRQVVVIFTIFHKLKQYLISGGALHIKSHT